MGKEDINEIIKASRLKAVAGFEDDLKKSEESKTLEIKSSPDGAMSDTEKTSEKIEKLSSEDFEKKYKNLKYFFSEFDEKTKKPKGLQMCIYHYPAPVSGKVICLFGRADKEESDYKKEISISELDELLSKEYPYVEVAYDKIEKTKDVLKLTQEEKPAALVIESKKPLEDIKFKNQAFKKIKEEKEIVKVIVEIYNKSKSKKVKEVGQETFVENTVNRFAHYPEGKTKDGVKYPAAAEIVKNIAIKIKSDEKYQLEEETIEKLKFYAERAAKAERGDIISGKKSKLKEPVATAIKPEEPPVAGEPIAVEEPPVVVGEPVVAKTSNEQLMTSEKFNEEKQKFIEKELEDSKNFILMQMKTFSSDEEREDFIEGLKLAAEEHFYSQLEQSGRLNIREESIAIDSGAEKREAERRVRQEKIEKTKAEVANARKEWLEVDYKKNTAFQRIRKYFSNKDDDNFHFAKDRYKDKAKMRSYESDQEIAAFRAYYDNELFKLQELLIEDAKANGASDEELANLYIEFQTEQKITVADDHDKIKAEYIYKLEEKRKEGEGEKSKIEQWKEKGEYGYYKSKNFLKEKTVGITKWYQALSPKTKIAIAVAFMGTGGALAFTGAGVGTAAGTFFAGIVGAKRIFSGMTTGIGTALGLEAQGQKNDREKIEKEKQEFLKKLEGLSEEEKYNLLSGNIKEIAIKDKENSINKIKNQDLKQLAAGALVGTFIGRGIMSDLFKDIKWISHDVIEHFSLGNDNVAGGVGGAGVVGAIENVPHEVNAPVNPVENLTFEKGSSFEGTIKNFLDMHREEFLKNHPELVKFNDGQIAHRIAIDFKDTHPEMDGNLPDYIHAGAKLEFNPITMEVEIKDPSGYGWYETTHGGGNDMPDNASEVEMPETSSDMPQHEILPEAQHNMTPENVSAHPTAPAVGVEYVPEHQTGELHHDLEKFNSSDFNLSKGSSVTFAYDNNGDPILKKLAFSGMLHGSTGQELFVGNFHEKIFESASNSGGNAQLLETELRGEDRHLLGYLKIHDELLKNGHTKEAAAVLNSINNEMDITEKRTGLSGLFDRSKLPIIDKNLPDYIHAGQEHLKPTDMFVVESGRVSFEYDSHGNITGVPDVEVSEDVPPISEGGYLLGDYTDKLSEGLKSGNYRVGDIPEIKKEFLTLADKIGRELYVHADLRRGGHIQEAKAVLKNIYDTMDATERKHGVSNIFDRDMIPRL